MNSLPSISALVFTEDFGRNPSPPFPTLTAEEIVKIAANLLYSQRRNQLF